MFDIAAFFPSPCRWRKKAAISKSRSFSTELGRSYIDCTLNHCLEYYSNASDAEEWKQAGSLDHQLCKFRRANNAVSIRVKFRYEMGGWLKLEFQRKVHWIIVKEIFKDTLKQGANASDHSYSPEIVYLSYSDTKTIRFKARIETLHSQCSCSYYFTLCTLRPRLDRSSRFESLPE